VKEASEQLYYGPDVIPIT